MREVAPAVTATRGDERVKDQVATVAGDSGAGHGADGAGQFSTVVRNSVIASS